MAGVLRPSPDEVSARRLVLYWLGAPIHCCGIVFVYFRMKNTGPWSWGSTTGFPAFSSCCRCWCCVFVIMGNGTSSVKLEESTETSRALLCRFCGGRACRHEDWQKQKQKSALKGLHSTWICDQIVASQRPSSRLIKEHGIVQQFQK